MISDRRKRILQAIIEEYIKTAMPISSSSLINYDDLNFSSATIRNEMAELEKSGLIKKTHTSSGRVPSQQGYRYYVDELLNNAVLNKKEIETISKMLEEQVSSLDNLTQLTAQIISQITHYAAISMEKTQSQDEIKQVQLVKLTDNLLLIIIIAKDDTIKETMIKYDTQIPDDFIDVMTMLFNKELVGQKLSNINIALDQMLMENTRDMAKFLIPIINKLNSNIKDIDSIHFEGTNNLLSYPEFDNIENVKKLMNLFSQKQIIEQIIDEHQANLNRTSDITIIIGDESNKKIFEDLSIITFSKNKKIGTIGIIRPQRMDYAKVISVIEYINKKLDELDEKN